MILGITGHRPDKLGGYGDTPLQRWVEARMREEITKLNPKSGITGMALGVDTIAAKIFIDYEIPFVAAAPFPGQEQRWPTESRVEYHRLLEKAKEVVVVSKHYYKSAFQVRNQWLVNRSDMMLSVWDGSRGGAKNCCDYADSIGRARININPNDYG